MNRIVRSLLVILLVAGLAACDSNKESSSKENAETTEGTDKADNAAPEGEEAAEKSAPTGPLTYKAGVPLAERLPGDSADALKKYAGAMALSADGKHVYVGSAQKGAVAVFARDTATGELTFKKTVSQLDGFPKVSRILSTNDKNRLLVFAGSFPGGPRPKFAVFEPDGDSLKLVADGPYHSIVAVSPDGKFGYGVDDGNVVIFERKDGPANYAKAGTAKLTDNGDVIRFEGNTFAISPDGKYLYASWNGQGEIPPKLLVFKRDLDSGQLEKTSEAPLGKDGGNIDSMTVSGDGKHLYVARTSLVKTAVRTFERDPSTGKLTPRGELQPLDNGDFAEGHVVGADVIAAAQDKFVYALNTMAKHYGVLQYELK